MLKTRTLIERAEEAEADRERFRAACEAMSIERLALRDILSEADRDIHEWLRFARRQMAEMPDWEHVPYGPTSSGVADSEVVRAKIRRVMAEFATKTEAARE